MCVREDSLTPSVFRSAGDWRHATFGIGSPLSVLSGREPGCHTQNSHISLLCLPIFLSCPDCHVLVNEFECPSRTQSLVEMCDRLDLRLPIMCARLSATRSLLSSGTRRNGLSEPYALDVIMSVGASRHIPAPNGGRNHANTCTD